MIIDAASATTVAQGADSVPLARFRQQLPLDEPTGESTLCGGGQNQLGASGDLRAQDPGQSQPKRRRRRGKQSAHAAACDIALREDVSGGRGGSVGLSLSSTGKQPPLRACDARDHCHTTLETSGASSSGARAGGVHGPATVAANSVQPAASGGPSRCRASTVVMDRLVRLGDRDGNELAAEPRAGLMPWETKGGRPPDALD
jgi:hypothetical protein